MNNKNKQSDDGNIFSSLLSKNVFWYVIVALTIVIVVQGYIQFAPVKDGEADEPEIVVEDKKKDEVEKEDIVEEEIKEPVDADMVDSSNVGDTQKENTSDSSGYINDKDRVTDFPVEDFKSVYSMKLNLGSLSSMDFDLISDKTSNTLLVSINRLRAIKQLVDANGKPISLTDTDLKSLDKRFLFDKSEYHVIILDSATGVKYYVTTKTQYKGSSSYIIETVIPAK